MTKAQERARAQRRQQKVAAARQQADKDRARNLRAMVVALVVLALVGAFVVLSQNLAGNDGPPAAQDAPTTTGAAGCEPAPKAPGTTGKLTLPPKSTAAGKTFTAVVTTNCGDITFELDGTKAPQTVASFLSLAQNQYWRDAPCHRLTTTGIFVLQCGDPTGSGGGNPGYGYGIENAPTDGKYPTATLAMARTQDPNSNGGQFFIVYKDTALPTDGGGYSIFGKVVGGMDIVGRVADAGVSGGGTDGTPAAPISILRIAVTEKKA